MKKLSYFEKVWYRKVIFDKCKVLADLWLREEVSTDNLIKALLEYKKIDNQLKK